MNMILTYVPESEYLTYDEALALAEERDAQAAREFEASVPAGEVMCKRPLWMLGLGRRGWK